jgi:uncharacterized protein YkwD
MKRILFLCLPILLVTLACFTTEVSVPATIPTMDLNRISTIVVETANALATANTSLPTISATPISTDTPIVITAANTATDTASPTTTPSLTITPTLVTPSPTNTSIPATKTRVKKTATRPPVATSTYVQADSPATDPTLPTDVPSVCPVFNASYEARVIDLINAERTNVGLPALSTQDQLGSAAQLHSVDMACNNYFSHTGLDGLNSGERAQRQGYGSSYVGENIAAGYSSPESVVQGWMNSPGHKANILGTTYTEIGVGYAFGEDSDYGAYWTADFASP